MNKKEISTTFAELAETSLQLAHENLHCMSCLKRVRSLRVVRLRFLLALLKWHTH